MMVNNHYAAMTSIYNLFERNAKLISKKQMGLNPSMGRLGLLESMFDAMQACEQDDVRLQSIVEKYGRMNVYYEGGDDVLHSAVQTIMDDSIKQCVYCGDVKASGHPLRCAGHIDEDVIPSTPEQLSELAERMKRIARMGRPEFEF